VAVPRQDVGLKIKASYRLSGDDVLLDVHLESSQHEPPSTVRKVTASGNAEVGSDAGATWTVPRPGETRLRAVLHVPSQTVGVWDLAEIGAYATVCNTGVLLDDPQGFFCGDEGGLRPADRAPITGSFDVRAGAPSPAYTLDARVGDAIVLKLVLDITQTTRTYPSYEFCKDY
jgi:hypothetical protein